MKELCPSQLRQKWGLVRMGENYEMNWRENKGIDLKSWCIVGGEA